MANPEDPTPNAPSPAPLAGVKVVDLSRILAGPLCTMVLADLGADVIKVERPGEGDDTRHWGPPFAGDDAAYFLSLNRNKRSVTADLGEPEGVAVVRASLSTADVLIENFRPGLMARFGLALDDLRRGHPRLVTCSLTAFGADAAETASRPGYDIIVQAMSGLMSVTGERGRRADQGGRRAARRDHRPLRRGGGAGGAPRARRHRTRPSRERGAVRRERRRHGEPGGQLPDRRRGARSGWGPRTRTSFRTSRSMRSDRPFILAAGNDRLFARTCEVVGHAEWADDPRFATNEARVVHRDELIPLLEECVRAAEHAGWLALLEDAGVPCAPIMAMDEVFASPDGAGLIEQVDDPVRGLLRLVANPIRFDGVAPATRMPPPLLGEHDAEVRREHRGRPGRDGGGPVARAAGEMGHSNT